VIRIVGPWRRCCGPAPIRTVRLCAIAPVAVPESGESAGTEAERTFTTDEVAMLLNVPLDTIDHWHQEGTGPPGYQTHKESHYRRGDVVRWLAEQGVMLAVCQSECGRTYALDAFTTVED
jgi:hypothetical protein